MVVIGLIALAAWWLTMRAKQADDALVSARDGVSRLRTALESGESDDARALLTQVQADTSRAADVTDDPVFALAAALPYVGNTPDAVRTLASASDDLADDALATLVDAGSALDPQSLQIDGNRIDLTAFATAAPLLAHAISSLTDVSGRVDGIDIAGTPARVADAVAALSQQLDDTIAATASASRGAELVPPMLGGSGERRYFLAFQSNNEARGTGGFFGSYGLASADDGEVHIDKLAPRSQLDDQTYNALPLDFGPDYAALYGDDSASWAGANLSPHYPYAAQLWLKMWQDRTGEELDGVVTTDPVTLSYLLQATGPITLDDGREINADNVVEFTESQIYEFIPFDDDERDAYLQEIAGAALDAVLSGEADPRALVDALGRAAGERRLLVYSSDSEEEQRLAETSVSGVVPDAPGPFVGLSTINGGGNKLDYYLRERVEYAVIGCRDDGFRRTRVSVSFQNDAPSRGLPLYVTGRSDGPLGQTGIPRNGHGDTFFYAQVYVAKGAFLSAAMRDGNALEVVQGQERGHPVYQVGLEIAAESGTKLTFELLEPPSSEPLRSFVSPLVKPVDLTADETECANG